MDLRPYLFCLSFYLLYFFLPPFKDNGLLLWVPDVLCQHLEVVLWNLLSVQMFFCWICGGESGLPVLFLCHLRTALSYIKFYYSHLPSSLSSFIVVHPVSREDLTIVCNNLLSEFWSLFLGVWLLLVLVIKCKILSLGQEWVHWIRSWDRPC